MHVARPAIAVLLTAALLSPLLAPQAAPAPVQQRKRPVQCWIDDRGQRACGDLVPPSEAHRQRQLVDSRGRTMKVLPAQKTAAEAAADAKAQQEREQAAAYDRYLIQAYDSEVSIEKTRDERLSVLDGRLLLAEKSLVDSEATLAELKKRAAAQPADKAPNAKLQAEISEFEQARTSNADAIKRIRGEREKIAADFARDILRYRELRGGRSP